MSLEECRYALGLGADACDVDGLARAVDLSAVDLSAVDLGRLRVQVAVSLSLSWAVCAVCLARFGLESVTCGPAFLRADDLAPPYRLDAQRSSVEGRRDVSHGA